MTRHVIADFDSRGGHVDSYHSMISIYYGFFFLSRILFIMFKGLSFDFMQVFFLCNFDNHNLNDVDVITYHACCNQPKCSLCPSLLCLTCKMVYIHMFLETFASWVLGTFCDCVFITCLRLIMCIFPNYS